MKNIIIIIQALICIICISNCSMQEKKTFDEEIYGQKPPGEVPEVYEPVFPFIEHLKPIGIEFSPDFNEILVTIKDTLLKRGIIYYSKKNNGKWDIPEIAYFVPNSGLGAYLHFSSDGKYISYGLKGEIWRSTKKGDKWTPAEKMPEPINTDGYECGIHFAPSGSIYLAGNGRVKGRMCEIYCMKNPESGIDSLRPLNNLNSSTGECSLSLPPNEKYIVFTRGLRRDGRNVADLHISFRTPDGKWTIAKKLGPNFNSPGRNNLPRFSHDGKYFFYQQVIWNDELEEFGVKQYWVSTKYFDNMQDFVFNSNEIIE